MIRVFENLQNLSQAAAAIFVEQAQQALAKGRFSVALSGGETPRQTYELLARSPYMDEVPWHIVHFFWGDERWVPLSDPRSNARMVREVLLDHIPVPDDQIHPMYRSGMSAENGANAYDHELRQFFYGERQLFDLVFLGLGKNGHTASLFPHTPVLNNRQDWVDAVCLEDQHLERVTLTPEAINRSAQVVFLVNGPSKEEVLHQVLEGPSQPDNLPAQLIQPVSNELFWLVDEAAAAKLSNATQYDTSALR